MKSKASSRCLISYLMCLSGFLLSCRMDRPPPPASLSTPSHPPVPPGVVQSQETNSSPLAVKPPSHFISNQGQLDPAVKYYFKGRSGSVYLTASGVVFDFIREREEVPEEGKEEKPSPGPAGDEPEKVYDRLSFRMLFDGANPDVEIAGEEELPGQMNYFIGSDPERWQTGIPTFAAVSCRDIYPGMEIVFRLEGGTLRWKAIVSPGADPSAIAFLYEGVEGLCLGKGGELLISTAFGVFVEPAPEIYQEEAGQKVFLEGGWKLRDDNLAAIATEGFEPSLPIIIER